jgi:glucose-6-phosphate 1-dehydrogenase
MAEHRKKSNYWVGRKQGSCLERAAETRLGHFVMVIFGGAGDLAARMLLPALYDLHEDRDFAANYSILGVGRTARSDESYRAFAASAIKKYFKDGYRPDHAAAFARHLHYITGSVDDDAFYGSLCERLHQLSPSGEAQHANLVFYLAVPPRLVPVIVAKLHKFSLCRAMPNAKLIVEKPFGHDRKSAEALNRQILGAFDEKQVFRIDHYLAKETVQNILFFRFGNDIFEPVWNTRCIDHVQITVAEDIGVEHRGAFYEDVGVIRDIVQNHLMQVLAMVAMEPPTGFEADLIRDERNKVFHSIRRMDGRYAKAYTVLGQYGPGRIGGRPVRGYRSESYVSPSSHAPTFFAGKFHIDNWRWAGVPFYLRTGKRLPRRSSEIYIGFKKLPLRSFGRACGPIPPNGLALSIQPRETIHLILTVKRPGMGNTPSQVSMDFDYAKSFRVKPHPVYERVLFDFIRGDLTLFPRQDEVNTTWALLDPLIKYWEAHPPARFPNYASGTWGPREAFGLMAREGRAWRFSGEGPE